MAEEMVRTRGTTIAIGTTAEVASTDTYTPIEGVRMLDGTAGITWSQIDGTTLTDTYQQQLKGVATAGTLTIGGPIKRDAVNGLAPGIAAVKAAAEDDTEPAIYNFRVVLADGRIKYKKARVFAYTEQLGNNANLNEWRATLILQAAPVEAAAGVPVNTLLPSISGIPVQGQELTAIEGNWTGAPAFTYKWQKDGSGWADIAGATAKTFTPTESEVGMALRVIVTATNGAGNASATSAPTAQVIAS